MLSVQPNRVHLICASVLGAVRDYDYRVPGLLAAGFIAAGLAAFWALQHGAIACLRAVCSACLAPFYPQGCQLNTLCCAALWLCIPLQLPSLHDARLSSLLGALMSAAYCIIAIAMSASVKHTTPVNYNPAAIPRSTIKNVMGIFNAMTTIFFAYGGHNVALEIQATIGINERNPSTVKPMMRGVNWTFLITGVLV